MKSASSYAVLTLLMLAVSCADSTAPDVRPASELHFLRPAPNAPPLADTVVTFWAKRGVDREIRLRYAAASGGETEEFLRFKVPSEALAFRPDGRPFAVGDSVLITVRIADFSRLIVDFQPSGLRFSTAHPAELRIRFAHADHDFNGDGVEDNEDDEIESTLALWRQEAPGSPWIKLGGKLEVSLEEVEGELLGFSGYALAY